MGRICSVIGCSNSTSKLEKWYSQLCDIHGLYFGSCVCKPPFQLFPFPTETKDPEARKRWINLVNRKTKDGHDWQPKYQDRVCSVHFLESEPTPSLPDPTECLGYDTLDTRLFSRGKLPRDPSEESLPFREIVEEIKAPKKRRKQEAPRKVQKKRKNKKEGSSVAIAVGMYENKEEQAVTNNEPLSMQEQHLDHSYCHIKANLSACEGCTDKVAKIKELERKVTKLKHQLKVAQSMQRCKSSVYEAVFSVLKSDITRRTLSDGIPAKAKIESLYSSQEPEIGTKRHRADSNKGSTSRLSQNSSNAC